MTPVKIDRSMMRSYQRGGFGIEIPYPGLTLDRVDSGIGAIGRIGRIDHGRIRPGTLVKMHPHRDDEILTDIRGGSVLHRDTVGEEEELTNKRLMLMNAGHTFQHEEKALGSEDLTALQIFIRPQAPDLEPMVQFHDFPQAVSLGAWRLIAGPKDEAPMAFRAAAWIHDSRLPAGTRLALPEAPRSLVTRLLYVFAGKATIGETQLAEGDSVLLNGEPGAVEAHADTDLVLFTTDTGAPVFKAGMFSGNILAR